MFKNLIKKISKTKKEEKNEEEVPPISKPLKIDKDTNIAELTLEYPHLTEVLSNDYELHCVGCFASGFDSLESGAQIHGMSDQEIDDMIKRLNQIHKQYLKKEK